MPTTTQMGADAHDANGFSAAAGTFASQGYKFVAQYIDQFSDANTAGSPSLTPAQVQQETSAGLSIVSIFQTNGMSSSAGNGYQTYFTTQQGASDGAEALSSAKTLGQPPGSTIYFAMDFDPAAFGAAGSEKQLLTQVQTYLTAVSKALGGAYSIGVYGAGDTLAAAVRNDPSSPNYNAAYTPVAAHGWLTQSYGWAGSNTMTTPPDANSQGWDIYQGNQTTANNVAIDPDTATSDSYGQWTLCFGPGTSIRTCRGDLPVEELRVGDMAATVSGGHRPVLWVGYRDLDGAGKPLRHDQQPVRVRAGAFGQQADDRPLPARDLYLSPGHPVLVGADVDGEGGVLVPIMCLVNGTSIARMPVETVTYWHVELDSHDILLAEDLPAESFLDYGNRGWFEREADHDLLHPDYAAPGLAGRCRPVVVEGSIVDAERRRLDTLFATSLSAQCGWPTDGYRIPG